MDAQGSINECCLYLKNPDFPDDLKVEQLNNLNECLSMLTDNMLVGLPVRDVVLTVVDYISVDVSEEQNVVALKCLCSFIRIHSVACDIAFALSQLVERVAAHLRERKYVNALESCVSILFHGSIRHASRLLGRGLLRDLCALHEMLSVAIRKQQFQLIVNIIESPLVSEADLREMVDCCVPMLFNYLVDEDSTVYKQQERLCVAGISLHSDACRDAICTCLRYYVSHARWENVVGLQQTWISDPALYDEAQFLSLQPMLLHDNPAINTACAETLGFLPWQPAVLQRVQDQVFGRVVSLPPLSLLQLALHCGDAVRALQALCLCLARRQQVPLAMINNIIAILETSQQDDKGWLTVQGGFVNMVPYAYKNYSQVYDTKYFTLYAYITTTAETDVFYIDHVDEISLPGLYVLMKPAKVSVSVCDGVPTVQISVAPSEILSMQELNKYHTHSLLHHICSISNKDMSETPADALQHWSSVAIAQDTPDTRTLKRLLHLLMYILQGVEMDAKDIDTYLRKGVLSMVVSRSPAEVVCALRQTDLGKPFYHLLLITPRVQFSRLMLYVFLGFPEHEYCASDAELFIQACDQVPNQPFQLLVESLLDHCVTRNDFLLDWLYSLQDVHSLYKPAVSEQDHTINVHSQCSHPYLNGLAKPRCFPVYTHRPSEQALYAFLFNGSNDRFLKTLLKHPWQVGIELRKQFIERRCLGPAQTAFTEPNRPLSLGYNNGTYSLNHSQTIIPFNYYFFNHASGDFDLLHATSSTLKLLHMELDRGDPLATLLRHTILEPRALRFSFTGETGFGSGPTTAGYLYLADAINNQLNSSTDAKLYSTLGLLTAYALLENRCFPVFLNVHQLRHARLQLTGVQHPTQKSSEVSLHFTNQVLTCGSDLALIPLMLQAADIINERDEEEISVTVDQISLDKLCLPCPNDHNSILSLDTLSTLSTLKSYPQHLVSAFVSGFTSILDGNTLVLQSDQGLLNLLHKTDYSVILQRFAHNNLQSYTIVPTSLFSSTYALENFSFSLQEHFSLKPPLTADTPVVQYLLRFLNTATSEQKVQFITFVTALNVAEYTSTTPTIFISKTNSTKSLPIASTCTKTLKLGQYVSYEDFEKHIIRVLGESMF